MTRPISRNNWTPLPNPYEIKVVLKDNPEVHSGVKLEAGAGVKSEENSTLLKTIKVWLSTFFLTSWIFSKKSEKVNAEVKYEVIKEVTEEVMGVEKKWEVMLPVRNPKIKFCYEKYHR